MNTPLKTLISKLDASCYESLEKAASICARLTHYDIEIEHWLLALFDLTDTAMIVMLKISGCRIDKIRQDINLAMESFRRGNDKSPTISNRVIDLINESWLIASLDYDGEKINSGLLLCALLQKHSFNQICHAISKEFSKINIDSIRDLLIKTQNADEKIKAEETDKKQRIQSTKTPALDQFTVNLNEQAVLGKIDPATGREKEISQIVDILSRRKQNNAILTGEPGVGKTAIVEGLALRIVQKDVPDILKNVIVHTLDLGLLQAGAGVKGEFENRLKTLIDEVKNQPYPIILFIDEAHTMIGAGASAGQGDAANLLKPALARGELRCIAATTWSEYKQYFEKDAALTRRFQLVKIEEPDTETAIRMLRSLVLGFEKHHRVRILESAIHSATILSKRYITGRYLPDKSISVLDTACSRVASRQTAKPAELEQAKKLHDQLEFELSQLKKETNHGFSHQDRMKDLQARLIALSKNLQALELRWKMEKKIADKIIDLTIQIDGLSVGEETSPKANKLKKSLKLLQDKLKHLQGDLPLVLPYVDSDAVAGVIADWTGIPVGRMLKDEISQIINIENYLSKRIVGQNHALKIIGSCLRISGAKLSDPNKPVGIFLFVGPSGVGKTETALALAEFLYNSEEKLTTINMSEFKEEHKISMLSGSPPGYVGYGEGGVLTEAVRRNPYSIILLDEMEKAHSGIQEVFYQVFDKGTLKDGQGRDINFKNTIIIMTSNACSEIISSLCSDLEAPPNIETINTAIHDELLKTFKPAFLGRVTAIPFIPLIDNVLRNIILLKINRIKIQLKNQHGILLTLDDDSIDFMINQCNNQNIGARQIDNILQKKILPELSEIILSSMTDDQCIKEIKIVVKNHDFQYHSTYLDKKTKVLKE